MTEKMIKSKPDYLPGQQSLEVIPLPTCPHCKCPIERDSKLYERIKAEVLLDVIMKRAEKEGKSA